MARRRQEVALHLVELDQLGYVLIGLGKAQNRARPKRGVRRLVDDRRSGRYVTALDPEVRSPIADPVAGAIPSVDGAVVQLQGSEQRNLSRFQPRERILLHVGTEQDPEATQIFLEQLQHRAVYPVLAEPHPRASFPQMRHRPSSIDRLLEQCDSCLGPQTSPKEERGIHHGGQNRSRHRLGGIVHVRELFRPRLKVNLKAGIAAFVHHGVVFDVKLIDPLDAKPPRPASHPVHRFVQRVIALPGRDVLERKI